MTSDVIASASLLMALVAALFGLWHVEIDRALREVSPTGDVARKVVRDRVGLVLWNKALPLAVSAIAVAVVFFPRSLAIGVSSFALIGREWRYNDLMAAFILTEIVLVALAILTALRAARLFKKWITLT